MPAVIILCGFVALVVFGLLTWRWLEVVERVKVARARFGGTELAKTVEELEGRVEKIERYVSGEDVYGKDGR